jgi:arylformamidase
VSGEPAGRVPPPGRSEPPDPGILDISPAIGPGGAVWPGDSPLAWQWVSRRDRGDVVNLGRLALSPHTGAHVDAPLHLEDGGPDAAALPLEVFWGPARVVDWAAGAPLDAAALARLPWGGVRRVLFRTRAAGEPLAYRAGYPAFTPQGAALLAARGVRLVGVDTPSVDPFESPDLPAHRALLGAGVAILECLELAAAEPGDYELVALPLRLVGADATPVRAALRRRG